MAVCSQADPSERAEGNAVEAAGTDVHQDKEDPGRALKVTSGPHGAGCVASLVSKASADWREAWSYVGPVSGEADEELGQGTETSLGWTKQSGVKPLCPMVLKLCSPGPMVPNITICVGPSFLKWEEVWW
ncbi:Uncharacterised protein [Chlamydia trachomatis]|nr:Uncharacterised protein [Chlamydia trachomatis]